MSTLQAICRRRSAPPTSPPAVDSRRAGGQTGVEVSNRGPPIKADPAEAQGWRSRVLACPTYFIRMRSRLSLSITKNSLRRPSLITTTSTSPADTANSVPEYPTRVSKPTTTMSRTTLARRAMLLPRRQPSPLTTSYNFARRPYSTQPPPPSATGDFYKTFTRPVAKCLLLALFTYQLTYWAWLKLEQDEIKMERTGRPFPRPADCC